MLAPLAPEKLPDDAPAFARALNVYRTMAHNPALLAAWAPLRAHVVLGGALTEAQKEIVILRTGYHWGSAYERAHHIVRGRLAGLSDARIARTAKPAEDWGADGDGADEDTSLMAAADALLTHGRLTDTELKSLDPAWLLDIIATIGFYTTLAFIVNSFETPIDAQIAPDGVPK
jgi:alkylhydroperoxidase family enzyme